MPNPITVSAGVASFDTDAIPLGALNPVAYGRTAEGTLLTAEAAISVFSAPEKIGNIANIEMTTSDAAQVIDLATIFTGADSYGLNISRDWLILDQVAETLTVDPTQTAGFSTPQTVVVTAYKTGGGSIGEGFSVLIQAASAGSAIDQTAEFGALTRTGATGGYGYHLTDGSGAALTGVTLTGGTATGVEISASGVLRPGTDGALAGQDGATVTFSSDQGSGTCTLSVIANAESVEDMIGFDLACDAAIAADSGRTIFVPRVIDTSGDSIFSASTKTNRPATPIIIRSQVADVMSGGFTHGIGIRHASNFAFEFLDIHDTSGAANSAFRIEGDCIGTRLSDCHLHGAYRDPLGDYTTQGSYSNTADGIVTVGSGRGYPGGLTVERCKIYDITRAGTIRFDTAEPITIQDNLLSHIYADGFNAVLLGAALAAQIVCQRNIAWYLMGKPTDVQYSTGAGPHIDAVLQFVSKSNQPGDTISNLVSRQNVAMEMAASRGRFLHGVLTSFTDGSQRITLENPLVEHNIVAMSGNHHTTIRANGGTFRNNTLVVPSATWAQPEGDSAHSFGRLNIELVGDNPVTVANNITEQVENLSGANAGTAPITATNNAVVGLNFSTIAMDTIFSAAETSSITEFSDFIARLTPATGGPADGTNQGAIVPGATFGAPMDPSGWAVPA